MNRKGRNKTIWFILLVLVLMMLLDFGSKEVQMCEYRSIEEFEYALDVQEGMQE